MEQVRFKGVPFFLNGREYIVPSLSLRQVQENDELLAQVHTVDISDREGVKKLMKLYIPIVGMALRRNYPDVKNEELADWLDLSNFSEAVKIVQNASGYATVSKLGEAEPAATTGAALSGS